MKNCPICNRPVERAGNPHRPFCSERCKLLDFGAWVNEEYTVPSDEPASFEEAATPHPAAGDGDEHPARS
ncbi:MAG TPA: DNA gyrase inhibitor YacG [Pyrinomonadaceae bacterium]|nr:DNA gyrase inhibitor YacG [Pyrinomonadaceae bacterium]